MMAIESTTEVDLGHGDYEDSCTQRHSCRYSIPNQKRCPIWARRLLIKHLQSRPSVKAGRVDSDKITIDLLFGEFEG